MYDPSIANIVTKTVSLNTGTPANAAVIPARVGSQFLISSLVVSSNDAALPLVTVDDNTANTCCAIYATSNPAVPYFGVPYKGAKSAAIRVSSTAITAAKTVEVSISGFYFTP